ncbi:MAG: DUF2087 domain-containing protein [Planctomycetota bacterium]|nr:DUF2087 domain-containing protein [Planctomycetota bacterium]
MERDGRKRGQGFGDFGRGKERASGFLNSGDRHLRSLERESLLNNDSRDHIDHLAWSMLRHGDYKAALLKIISARSRFQEGKDKGDERGEEVFFRALQRQLEACDTPTRGNFIEAVIELLEDEETETDAVAVRRFLKDVLSSLSIKLVTQSRLLSELGKARGCPSPPRKGILRLVFLMVIREGLPAIGRLHHEDFDSIITRGQGALKTMFRFGWHYDDNHLRRYLVQFGMVERTTDGREYWQSKKCLSSVALTVKAKEHVQSWWKNEFRSRR